jgi:mandelate racemase
MLQPSRDDPKGPTMTAIPRLTRARARGVEVTMRRPVVTAGGAVTVAPLVLVDLETDAGVVGRSYVFTYTPAALRPTAQLVENMGAWLAGAALAPAALERKLQRRLRLLGAQGLAMLALSALDMAAWDAAALVAAQPLARLLGGAPAPVPAYNSCGLGLIGAASAPDEAAALAAGFAAIKLRLGYGTIGEDVATLRAVKGAVGPSVRVLVDYNQSLTVAEAIRRARALDDEGVEWIEEPTAFDDDAGHARIAAAARTPVQIGENWWGPRAMARSIDAGACDLVMPDAGKIGGVTGWLRAAALAETHGLGLSSHLYPEISAQLLAVSPTAHWLEWVDWAEPILARKLPLAGGFAAAPDAPGAGIEWDEAAIARLG